MKHSMQLLREAARGVPLCVGLDTDPSYIPKNILARFASPAEAVLAYNRAIVERVARDGSACCFKIQVAYYEAMGLAGMKAYAETLRIVRSAGFVAISDVKRGDIAATAEAYARAHFSGDFESDIVTLNPYMGFDTLAPFADFCAENGKGAFVLLCTSNPGAADIEMKLLGGGSEYAHSAESVHKQKGVHGAGRSEQLGVHGAAGGGREKNGGRRVFELVGDELNRICDKMKSVFPDGGCSPFGAVVGCTRKDDAEFLRKKYPEIFFLIPGYGAQGGDAEICATLLREAGGVVNSSRAILCAYKNDLSLADKIDFLDIDDIAESAARAALASKSDLMKFLDSGQ